MNSKNPDSSVQQPSSLPGLRSAVLHALLWLVAGNMIGVMIALLLLLPGLNPLLGEWTYGRWIMVHMNLGLFGWCSLPMLGFLFGVYGVEQGPLAAWARPVTWLWSSALVIGSFSWLSGDSSGKLFLDWSGLARIFFPLAMLSLWALLAISYRSSWTAPLNCKWSGRVMKLAGLAILLAVPAAIYIASSPTLYPAVNPDTGGPTGASQLESSLGVTAILLLLPLGVSRRKSPGNRIVPFAWLVLLLESACCVALGRADASHHQPAQYLGLSLLLVWIPLIPAYYTAFAWRPSTQGWRRAFYWWWGGLVVSGWIFFLPGVLDHFKFTDGLVGHSLTAIAGCLTAYLIFILTQMLGDDGWIFLQRRSFLAWNLAVLLYVLLMAVAGWYEGSDPAFTIVAHLLRNTLYILRLLTGLVMLASSLDWMMAAFSLNSDNHLRRTVLVSRNEAA
jgi:cytochrome c oxidase cbb3-type subunit 1